MTDQQQPPTPQELEQMQNVSQAGAAAAAEGNDPAAAMKEERDRVGLAKLSDEDIDAIAQRFNELNVEEFRKRGAFDPPPAPVSPPAQPQAPPTPGDQPADEAHTPPPQKRTPAHRFLGL